MDPQQPLTIYELRAIDETALSLFEEPQTLCRLGPTLAGLHWESDFAFVFFLDRPEEGAAQFLSSHPRLSLRQVHELSYGQWQDGAGATPFTVAGLTVSPAEGAPPLQPGERRILIDPGLAFGFGGHPTTYSCLDFLGRVCHHPQGPPSSALDLGAGTGILSLAAARWGVKKVIGVDYSHLAVDAAQLNVRLNRLETQVQFHRGPAQTWAQEPAELLMANLHLSLQEELLALGAFQKRRQLIISGLLPSEGDKLLEQLRLLGYGLTDQVRTDRWITMFLENKDG